MVTNLRPRAGGCISPGPRREYLADTILIARALASAISLLILSPWRARRKTLGALRQLDSVESVSVYVRDENPTKAEPPIKLL
jgi:hypothetical protein